MRRSRVVRTSWGRRDASRADAALAHRASAPCRDLCGARRVHPGDPRARDATPRYLVASHRPRGRARTRLAQEVAMRHATIGAGFHMRVLATVLLMLIGLAEATAGVLDSLSH